jgi:hypothetical protein
MTFEINKQVLYQSDINISSAETLVMEIQGMNNGWYRKGDDF